MKTVLNKLKAVKAVQPYFINKSAPATHRNDPTACAIGYKFAVIGTDNKSVGYFYDYKTAVNTAKRCGGKVVYITGNHDRHANALQMNPILVNNPVKEFNPEGYLAPSTTKERFAESMSPGLRRIANLASSPYIPGTEWAIPDYINIPVPTGLSYMPHQKAGIIAMARRGNVLLADEPRLGKTIQVAGYINLIEPDKTLVVAPMAVVRQWVTELDKWLVKKHNIVVYSQMPEAFDKPKKKKDEPKVRAKRGEGVKSGKFFFSTKVVNGKPILTLLADQERPTWDILVTSYNAFHGKATSNNKPLITKEDEAEYNRKQRFTVRLNDENLGYFADKDDAIIVAVRNQKEGYEPFEIVQSKSGKFKLNRINIEAKKVSPTVRKLCRQIERQPSFDLIVLDEVHMLKSIDAMKTKAFFGEEPNEETGEPGYSGIISFANKRIFLTGTPMVNAEPMDMFHFLHSLDEKQWVDPASFAGYFGGKKAGGKKGRPKKGEEAGLKNQAILRVKLRDTVMIRRLQDDVLVQARLKEDHINLVETELTRAARALEDEELKKLMGDDYDAKAALEEAIKEANENPNAATEAEMQIDQDQEDILNDPDVSDEEKAVIVMEGRKIFNAKREKLGAERLDILFQQMTASRHLMGLAKVEQTGYILSQIQERTQGRVQDGKIVFFAHHKDVIRKIIEACIAAGYRQDQIVTITGGDSEEHRFEVVHAFQNDKNVKIFIGSITTAGAGITLNASNCVVLMELDWRPGYVKQALQRITGIGQRADILYTFYPTVRNSVDANVAGKLVTKNVIQSEALDGLPTDYNGNINERVFEKYEHSFVEKPLPNCKYQAKMRNAVAAACNQIVNKFDEIIKNDGYVEWNQYGLQYDDYSKLKILLSEVNDVYSYNGPALKSVDFPERYITEALPVIFKLKGHANSRTIGDIAWPDSITGRQSGLFKPMIELDTHNSALHYLKAMIFESNKTMRADRAAERKARRAAAAAVMDGGTDIDELNQLVTEMSDDNNDGEED